MSTPETEHANEEIAIPDRRRIPRRASALFAVLALILSTVAVQVYRVVGDFVDASSHVTRSMSVRQEIVQTIANLHDAEASHRAYMITSSPERLTDFSAAVPRIAQHLQLVQELVADNPEQIANADKLSKLIEARLDAIHEVLVQFNLGGIDAARASTQTHRSRAEDAQIDALTQRMMRHEKLLLAEREGRNATQATLTRVLTVGGILFSILILGLALKLLIREQRHRLASMVEARSANRELRKSLEDSRRLSQTLRQLADLGEMLQGCRNIEEATIGLSTAIPKLLPRSSGAIHLLNPAQDLIESIAQWGDSSRVHGGVFAPDDCWALRRGHAYPLAGVEPAFVCRHLQETMAAHPDQAHLCVPMAAQGEMLGVIAITSDDALSGSLRDNIIAACEPVSMAIANLKLQETLRAQSLRDPLTGLFNRRYLEASFERELQRAARRQTPLSVLMMDVDHFKRFNDNHGHDAGDALLAHLGALFLKIVRSEDVCCRYGGEEFTVLMPEIDASQAFERAGEICAAVRAMQVEHRGLPLDNVTISIGVASYAEHGRTAEELLRNADNALYMAKNAGRDRVMLAETLYPQAAGSTTPDNLARRTESIIEATPRLDDSTANPRRR